MGMSISPLRRAEIRQAMREVIAEGNRIHVIPFKERWIVRSEAPGEPRVVFRSRVTAMERARALAARSGGELVVHGRDGAVQERESFRDSSARSGS